MSFRALIDTAQCIALADKLHPSEVAVWERYCREFSQRFATPLLEVQAMDPLFVLQQIMADNLSEFDPEERLEDVLDLLGSLEDPEYDAKRERIIREQLRKMEDEERERLKSGRAVHPSLEKDKRVIVKDDPKIKELPKSGGLNMQAINRLNNQDSEG